MYTKKVLGTTYIHLHQKLVGDSTVSKYIHNVGMYLACTQAGKCICYLHLLRYTTI